MTPETWAVVLVASAFLLVGIAVSPLAWIALRHRRSRFEQQIARQVAEVADRLRLLEARLQEIEAKGGGKPGRQKRAGNGLVPHWPHWPRATDGWHKRAEANHAGPAMAPTLIAVPSLAAPPSEREASIDGISHRYAAIWSLADSGASADMIARATGHPIGQIELIMGLRRQIDASRNKTSHGQET
jgi:hypothetical protein